MKLSNENLEPVVDIVSDHVRNIACNQLWNQIRSHPGGNAIDQIWLPVKNSVRDHVWNHVYDEIT